MEKMEIIKKLIQEFMVPEFEVIKGENRDIKTILMMMNNRMNDMNTHLVDQSRRMDETNKRIDDLRVELRGEITGLRVELKDEINQVRGEIFKNTNRIDNINMRLDNLYAVVVRREEHERLEEEVARMRAVVQEKMAA